jgi:hypothetical protein
MAAATHTALPSWSQRLISELDAADRRAESLAKTLTSEQLNWRPKPDVWSVGQCLQHLCLFNEGYLPAISTSLEGRRRARVQEITPGRFGRWFIRKYVETSSESRRTRAPKKIEPGKQVESSILESFLRINQIAREVIYRASDHDVNRIRFKNPFIPMVRFTAGTGLEIVSKHQSRHLLQAERVLQCGDFPER